MENQKKNNKTYLLISLGVLAAIVITLGITYAYWRLTREQTNENVVTTACLDVDIESEQDDINLPKAYPISDTDAESLVPFKFTIHNKCEDYANFQINLESMEMNGDIEVPEDQRLNPKYLKFKLNEVEQIGITGLLTGEKEEDTTSVTPTITNAYDAHKLMNGYIEPNGSKNYEFRLWMDSETTAEETDSMNKTFVSKISVTSTYIEEDNILPTANLEVYMCDNVVTAVGSGNAKDNKTIKEYEYQIDSKGWNSVSAKETYSFEELLPGSHKVEFRTVDSDNLVSKIAMEEVEIAESKSVDIYGMQIPIETCKSGLYEVEHTDVSGTTDDSGFSKTEYRYAGDKYGSGFSGDYAHNYVEFNNEKWQIIGLVNVKDSNSSVVQRLKIVRSNKVDGQQDFGQFWYTTGVGFAKDLSSDWTQSSLMKMLNGIYYNSESGECPNGEHADPAEQTTCDFTQESPNVKGIDDNYRQMIDNDVVWSLGGVTDDKVSGTPYETFSYTAKEYYELERSNNVYGEYPVDWIKENLNNYHNGIGLMYPSDFGYSTRGGKYYFISEGMGKWSIHFSEYYKSRSECLNSNYSGYYNTGCSDSSWLKDLTESSLTHLKNSSYKIVGCNGTLSQAGYKGPVKPTLYLKPTVTIISGTGEFNDPYQLSISE